MSHTAVMRAPLQVSVVNANLKFVRQPTLVGHYRSIALTGSEHAMDTLLGGAMSTSLQVNLYPDESGSNQAFVNTQMNRDNPLQPPRPDAVIVVGLGEEGKLTAADLTVTVRQGVVAWAQRLSGFSAGRPQPFELAATLIGSSGTGNPAGQSARLVAQGVRDANVRLVEVGWPTVRHLHLVELYLDRATEAWRSLQILATSAPRDFVITPFVQSGLGALQRPLDPSYRGSEYDLIAALSQQDAHGEPIISYTVDTRRARTEVRAQTTQLKLLRELTSTAADDANDDKQIGRSLFRMLVPLEMQPFLGGSDAMLLELDRGTAGIPWELLDTTPEGERDEPDVPWAIRTKLLRKLRTGDFRPAPHDANADSHVLVIGEPRCDDPTLPRLPAARAEARAIADLFKARIKARDGSIRDLVCGNGPKDVGPDARTVINALLERDWRIIHIAGHGEPPDPEADTDDTNALHVPPDPRGVVLSRGTFLGPREVEKMPVVPELVFVNCCFTAVGDAAAVLTAPQRTYGDRARFAAGIAEALINIGVRCVIASGWAVEDEPAMSFARTFYEQLLNGARFIDAVAAARVAAREKQGNTWAAYQCYGDPDWRFASPISDAQQVASTDERKYAGVASWNTLVLALEAISVESKYQDYDLVRGRQSLAYLETQFAEHWEDIGAVAQEFGQAWAAIGDQAKAIAWYSRALGANDGSASIKAMYELGNLRARTALESVDHAHRMSEASGEPNALASALEPARKEIRGAIDMLTRIADMQPTIDGESLCGSAWKRLSMLELMAGDRPAELDAIAKMRVRYANAEVLARNAKHPKLFYPALNRMAAELVLDAASAEWPGFDELAVTAVRESLLVKGRDDPDFWSVVGATELRVYEAMARRALAPVLGDLLAEYDALYARVSASWMWSSVYDQARWVLPKYVSRVDDDEDKAAMALVAHLGQLATGR